MACKFSGIRFELTTLPNNICCRTITSAFVLYEQRTRREDHSKPVWLDCQDIDKREQLGRLASNSERTSGTAIILANSVSQMQQVHTHPALCTNDKQMTKMYCCYVVFCIKEKKTTWDARRNSSHYSANNGRMCELICLVFIYMVDIRLFTKNTGSVESR